MVDLIRVEYGQTGQSTNTDALGMREMQARAFAARNKQYLLLKAPPASGKSRALMFLGLDKLLHQGLQKVIVSVPEMAIGASFKDTALSKTGFFADWEIRDHNNLCMPGGEKGKVAAFKAFMESTPKTLADRVLVCTHATLRFAFEKLPVEAFNETLLAIDEFHHVSADEDNQLGKVIDTAMHGSNAHIIAMTGSYFRGDSVPILLPQDEVAFEKVTYTYYEQLNGYQHLKSLGIGYHFYQGRYIEAVGEVLDTNKKTIIHIPNVNAGESTKDKYQEVDALLDAIGSVEKQDAESGVIYVRRHGDGKTLKVANLVEDDPRQRERITAYLRTVESPDDMDVIIALGMAKEGFDWPWCEHVLTIGYRNSMTEVIQIIGRATRDAPGKGHAQFTNLIAQPNAEDDDVKVAVNNMLKAITVSLLMEQVLAPTFKFKPRPSDGPLAGPGVIHVGEDTKPPSKRAQDVLTSGVEDITAELLQKPQVAASAVGGVDPEVISRVELPKIIQSRYPDLSEEETEQVRAGVMTQLAVNTSGGLWDEDDLPDNPTFVDGNGRQTDDPRGGLEDGPRAPGTEDDSKDKPGSKQFLKISDKFINIEDLNIDLIDQVNPFQGAYEILSKSVTATMLKTIQDTVAGGRVSMSEEEAAILWPKIQEFYRQHDRKPSLTADDPIEVRYAEGLAYLNRKYQERQAQAKGEG